MPMRLLAAAHLFAFLLLAKTVAAAEPEDPLAGFDEYVQAALADFRTPGLAIAVINDGKIILARGYGVRRVGEQEPIDEFTVFPIASVTKVFTATSAALLVDEGKLKFNDPVVKHVPEFELYHPFLTRDVQIDDLLSHRVGVQTANLVAWRGDYDWPEVMRRFRYLQPVSPYRGGMVYHNQLMSLVGEVVKRASGQPWNEFLRTRLLTPLEMPSTFVSQQEVKKHHNVAMPHELVEGKLIPLPAYIPGMSSEAFERLMEVDGPAGALQSNAMDLAKIVQLYLADGTLDGRQILKPMTVRTMLDIHSVLPGSASQHSDSIFPDTKFLWGSGLGWHIRDFRGRKLFQHSGSSGAMVGFIPEERIGIVVLSNRPSGISPITMYDTIDRLLGVPRRATNRDWIAEIEEKPAKDLATKYASLDAARTKDTKPSLAIGKYAGTYECDLYGKLEIQERDGSLWLQFGPNIGTVLTHWEHDTFRAKLSFPDGEECFIKFKVSAECANHLSIESFFASDPMPEFRRTN